MRLQNGASVTLALAAALLFGGCVNHAAPPALPSGPVPEATEPYVEKAWLLPWTMFQANSWHSGYRYGVPPVRIPKVRWKAEIGIQGYLNNPVIANGLVFVGSSGKEHNKSDPLDGVYCLDAASGKMLWHFRTDEDACGVAFWRDRIFATGDDGFLRCLAARDGKPLWKLKCEGRLYCQPLIFQDMVLVGDASGCVVAVDPATGAVRWRTKVANAPATVRGGLAASIEYVYAVFVDGSVACLDPAGRTKWTRRISEKNQFYPAPTVDDGVVYLGYARDTFYTTAAIVALDAGTGKTKWGLPDRPDSEQGQIGGDFTNIRSSFAVWKGLLLYGETYSNELAAYGADSGKKQWSVDLGKPMFPHWPSPAIAGNVLYLPRHDGAIYAVDLESRKMIWQMYLGDVAQVGPNLPAKIMPSGWEHCAWDPAVGKPLYASPGLDSDGTIFVGSGQGWLYAIEDSAPAPGLTELYGRELDGKLLHFERFKYPVLFSLKPGCVPMWYKDGKEMLAGLISQVRSAPPESRIIILAHRAWGPIRKSGGEVYHVRCAEAVKDFLVSQGVAPNRIQCWDCQNRYPLKNECTGDGWAANQRTEIAVVQQFPTTAPASGPSPERAPSSRPSAAQSGAKELYGRKLEGKLLRMDRISTDKLFHIARGCIPKWNEEPPPLLAPSIAAIKAAPANTRIIVFSHRAGDIIRRNGGELYCPRCADKVRDYLIQQGIAADRIQAFGMRDDFRLIVPERTAEAKKTNQRIEIVLVAPE